MHQDLVVPIERTKENLLIKISWEKAKLLLSYLVGKKNLEKFSGGQPRVYDQCGWVVGVSGKSQLCQLIGMKRVTLGQFTNFIPVGLFSTTWGRTMKEQLCHCFQKIQVNRQNLKQCFYRN